MDFRLRSEEKKKENLSNAYKAWLFNILANNLLKVIVKMLMKYAKITEGEVILFLLCLKTIKYGLSEI